MYFDFKKIADKSFDSEDFVKFSAEKGSVKIENNLYNIISSYERFFYRNSNIGKTQVRMALVEDPLIYL